MSSSQCSKLLSATELRYPHDGLDGNENLGSGKRREAECRNYSEEHSGQSENINYYGIVEGGYEEECCAASRLTCSSKSQDIVNTEPSFSKRPVLPDHFHIRTGGCIDAQQSQSKMSKSHPCRLHSARRSEVCPQSSRDVCNHVLCYSKRDIMNRTVEARVAASRDLDGGVESFLHWVGFPQYKEFFEQQHISGELLPSLENIELRDGLGVTKLRHRREIMKGVHSLCGTSSDRKQRFVPEFGRILIHLSNMRTFHSWITVGLQHFVFGIALNLIAPTFRTSNEIRRASIYIWAVGLGAHLYATARYWSVARVVDTQPDDKIFVADELGTILLAIATAATAALTLHLILKEGF